MVLWATVLVAMPLSVLHAWKLLRMEGGMKEEWRKEEG